MKTRFALIASLAALAVTAPAMAQSRSMTVRHGDLNLSTDAGRATLNHRIERAAKTVCGYAVMLDLRASMAVDECRSGAIDAAQEQLAARSTRIQVAAR